MAQKNSFLSLLEQIAQLNKNSVEIITKLNDVVASKNSSVSVNYQNNDGRVSKFELPTVGWLKKEIDIANSNIKKLTTLEGDNSVTIIDTNNNSKKIKSIDLSREPDQIFNLDVSTTFKQSNNWFFESLANPLLSIELDLAGKIIDNVTKILSRRYIIKFERDLDGNLTTNGSNSKTSFESTFLNKNDFTVDTFLEWLNNATNVGVMNKTDENNIKDEQFFDLNYKVINYKGYFSVLKMEKDALNKKVWYHLNTLNYYDRNGGTRILGVGDTLAINNKNSYSKYRILEVNTSSSLFRVSVERIDGYDPIPIGSNVLEYYSTLQSQTTVNISIGFDEYNVLFVKGVNTDNNVICSDWSRGMCFYSNDLVLSTDNKVNMIDFYLDSVYDYGALLKDLVAKRIPSQFASKPNKPTLISDNFKVVQINKHLTDSKDYKTLKKLHSQKNSVKSKLNELSDSITYKNLELNTKVFKSIAEKSRAQNEMYKLVSKQESDTKLFSSYVNQITNSRVEEKADPKFRARGFWDIPDPIIKTGYKTQEVIGFEVQYRYGSKFGIDNATEGFPMVRASYLGTPSNRTITAYFSQWNTLKTDIRKRTYDETSGKWIWEIENVSDADTPNINQLDISIQSGEKVEIRIRSISEVGYPETPLYSDWSDTLTLEFPDELNDVLGENQFILKEATQEEMRVNFESELTAKGLTKHVQESFYVNEQYYAHSDKTIATSFKDSFGNTLSLFDYLKQMNDKISALEEAIKRAKGELKITLFKGTQETEITNGSTINVVINCEDYMTKSSGYTGRFMNKSFDNNIYLVDDFYLEFENIASESNLGLISSYKFEDEFLNKVWTIGNEPTLISDDGVLYNQCNYQYLWFCQQANLEGVDTQMYDVSGSTSLTTPFKNAIYDNTKNTLINEILWTNANSSEQFGATVHPFVQSKDANSTNTLVDNTNEGLHIINAQKSEKIPIQLYFKPDITQSSNSTDFNIQTMTTPSVLKKALKVKLDTEYLNVPFEFTIIFKLIRHRQFAFRTDYVSRQYYASSYKKWTD